MSAVYADMFNILTRKAKNDDKPAYFKKLILSYLYTLDYDDEGRTLKKAGMPIETVREWKGKKAASG